VDAEDDRLRFTGQVCDAERADFSFDARLGNVNDFRHGCLLSIVQVKTKTKV